MRWPHSKKQHILLDTLESPLGIKRVKIDVYLQGKCGQILEERDVHIEVGDEIMLGLQRVKIEDKTQSGYSASFKMILRYSEGVTLKFVTRRYSQTCGVVNTWVAPSILETSDSQDWFSTPQPRQDAFHSQQQHSLLAKLPVIAPADEDDMTPVPDFQNNHIPTQIKSEPREISMGTEDDVLPPTNNPTVLPSTKPTSPPVQPPPAEKLVAPALATIHRPEPSPVSIPAPVQAMEVDAPPQLSKRQQKRLRDKERQKRKLEEGANPQTVAPADKKCVKAQAPPPESDKQQHRDPPEPVTSDNRKQAALESIPEPELVQAQPQVPKSVPVVEPVAASMVQAKPDGPLALKPGRKTRFMTFPPLSEAKRLCSVAGVVVSATTPNITRSGDLNCTLGIVDPSICKQEDDTYRDPCRWSMKVNCFAMQQGVLPCPQLGDVVILANVKPESWKGGVNLVGYKDRLQWAIYSSERGEIHHGDDPEGLKSELQQTSAVFTPFHEARDGEIEYCKDLIGWWRAIEEENKRFNSRIIHLGGEETGEGSLPLAKTARPFWRIEEIHCGGNSNGYFDTVVEIVLCGKCDLENYYLLFVTDYTSKEGLSSFESSKIHRSLHQSIAKLECWDESRKIAQELKIGDYLSLKNVRCRVDSRGSYELKIQEPKIKILNEANARYDKAFADLLERKKAHQSKHGTNDPSEIEHRNIKDVEESKFFSSVMEVLHKEPQATDDLKAVLYVTDYTPNAILDGTMLPKNVPAALEGKVLKLVLCDSQAQLAKQLKQGDIVSLHKMRITKSHARSGMSALIGGDEKLVHRLNPGVDSHKVLIEGLTRNKDAWKQLARRSPISPRSDASEEKTAKMAPPQQPLTPTTSTSGSEVKEVVACPTKFRIYARITDFFPDVEDWVYRWCRNCKKDIPTKRRACFDCNDPDHEFVKYKYRFWLMLGDEMGSELIVSVIDDCPILDGLPRVDLTEDPKAYQAVLGRLSALGGNVQKHVSNNMDDQDTKLESPFLLSIVVSWINDENEKLYSFEDCTLPS
ncbi:hypothetical protein L218DRAFT_943009 [Marasmius fiardii PR-910]|nr:hypothetical protein L218DRAFT_943009 [Marasmius fiardii PR-910]